MKNTRVLIIDSANRQITEGTVSTLEDMQKLVGGYIAMAYRFKNGDCLYVNDEGLLGSPKDFFGLKTYPIPFACNGFVIGDSDDDGEETDAVTKLKDLESQIRWLSPLEATLIARRTR